MSKMQSDWKRREAVREEARERMIKARKVLTAKRTGPNVSVPKIPPSR